MSTRMFCISVSFVFALRAFKYLFIVVFDPNKNLVPVKISVVCTKHNVLSHTQDPEIFPCPEEL